MNLGGMRGAGFPVPDGFVVLAGAFRAAMQAGDVAAELERLHRETVAAVRHGTAFPADTVPLGCRRVRKAGMPPEMARALTAAYRRLGRDEPVAVRSSAVGEDSAETSYAGMNATFTNVRGAGHW